ncbi:MAG TPA: transcriptional regulator [Holosporales bacterium]|nr:transcriptional regulator [Holosporales bacterium]
MTTQIPDTDLKALRKKLGLTQREFAEKYYMEIETLKSWEQGKRSPTDAVKLLLFLIENMPLDIEKTLEKYNIS